MFLSAMAPAPLSHKAELRPRIQLLHEHTSCLLETKISTRFENDLILLSSATMIFFYKISSSLIK